MTRLPDKFRERTKRYAIALIRLFEEIPKHSDDVRHLTSQLLRAATALPANVRSASRARSAAAFVSKLDAAVEEADRTLFALELLREQCSVPIKLTEPLEKESAELIAIFTTMIDRTLEAEQKPKS